ncbi:chromate transport protein [Deinococcus xinjiangensis]|uniref:Chromate transport protein n=1 Tax=Deinococcus xinjiangensis TaxID=457454 RepID=A0ABP9V6U2_9DEIO
MASLASAPAEAQQISPSSLFGLFVGVALAGVGGGLPAHTRRAVLRREWLSDAEFAEVFTLAQLTPGPNAVNLAAMVGAKLAGKRGALSAVAGVLLPGFLTMLAVTVGLSGGVPPALQSALRGAACAALGVMLTAALPVVKVGAGVRGGPWLTLLAFVGLGVLRLNLIPVLLVLVGVGLWLNRPSTKPPAAAEVGRG